MWSAYPCMTDWMSRGEECKEMWNWFWVQLCCIIQHCHSYLGSWQLLHHVWRDFPLTELVLYKYSESSLKYCQFWSCYFVFIVWAQFQDKFPMQRSPWDTPFSFWESFNRNCTVFGFYDLIISVPGCIQTDKNNCIFLYRCSCGRWFIEWFPVNAWWICRCIWHKS